MSKNTLLVQMFTPGTLNENTIVLRGKLVKQWKIPTDRPLQLAFGSFKQEITVVAAAKTQGLRISEPLARRMGLFSRPVLRATYNSTSRTLRLGPLISVLISRDDPKQPDKPFGAISMFCRELVNACRKQGAYVYFFTPDHIEEGSDSIHGWVYEDGWHRAKMPIADVINNRLTTRKMENKPSVQHFMKEVKSRFGTHFFNERFLDKNEVFDTLKADSSLAKFMPESYLLKGFSTLKKMCQQYPVVFLKPVRGSLGKGIIRIARQPDGTYQTLTTSAGGARKQTYSSVNKLFTGISGKMKTTRYQIQQGLTLIDYAKRPIDFRALVQKNGYGKWNVTSIVARIAGGNHFVSNLARGGTLSTVKDAVSRCVLPAEAKKTAYTKLQRTSLEIAKGIDTLIPAHFGELGIDLAMDNSGKIWLLEVNSKPSKNDNTPLNGHKVRPSVKRLLEYCCYLSGF
ncbi:YheC/YheD family protein [Paenibacillus sp.]|jgi:glutathione synthase/RimK-type ligase-like ATP-grasp enzyme|uniref:YheC/YheD family endospore coat-associated protein n=1 Tax=Paenibacillus sp. TaxID=58172 RepID=UPI00281B322B|nr:YheC/YheD family protein [Paenibacillus sp.]MDR0266851.1 YheC/YheD family protein [Paenibacillus sp.]